ncbi:MAG: DUF4350 domain-containing protein, partial [Acidimicrobiales bacterium]
MNSWGRLPAAWRGVVVVIGVVVALNLLASVGERAFGGGESHGPPGSSYTTAADGLAAYADFLADRGHAVSRLREPLADAELDPAATLVVAGRLVAGPGDRTAVRSFVERGGRLVAIGPLAAAALADSLGTPPRWSGSG